MKEKKGKSKKEFIIRMVICIGLLCVIWACYFRFKIIIDRKINVIEDDFSWVYQVDAVEVNNGKCVFRGFAFKLDTNAGKKAFEIVLRDVESGKMYFPKMEYMEREDVNHYFLCEYDYMQSGFMATIKEKKLKLQERNYEVLVRATGEKEAYQTGIYLSKGKLMYVNPAEFAPLEVAGTDLEEVVEQGILRVYRSDYGMYVYQYKGELYWIAEPDYDFIKGDTYVHYQLNTTQIDHLPQERLENQWYWDNIGFNFTTNELSGNMGKYRVTKKALPTEYSITKIWTGNADAWWVWRQDFRPYYFLEND